MYSGSELGSYLRLINFVYHSTLGLREIKKKKKRSGFRAQGLAFGAGFRVQGSGFRIPGSGFRVQGSGFRGWGFKSRGSGVSG